MINLDVEVKPVRHAEVLNIPELGGPIKFNSKPNYREIDQTIRQNTPTKVTSSNRSNTVGRKTY